MYANFHSEYCKTLGESSAVYQAHNPLYMVGPSKSVIRNRLQTSLSGCGKELRSAEEDEKIKFAQ